MTSKKKRTNKKVSSEPQVPEINLNLNDLIKIGSKLLPQLLPIAKQIASDLQNAESISTTTVVVSESKKKPKRKATKKKAKKKSAKSKRKK